LIILFAALIAAATIFPIPLAAETMPPEYTKKQVNACFLAMRDAISRVAEIADPSRTRVATSQLEIAQNQIDQREQGCMTHIDNATRAMKERN
jgi:hypothetical protein